MLQNVIWDLGCYGSFDVILGLCGLKKLRREEKAVGLKRKRSKRSNPLETSSLFFVNEGKNLSGHWF
jgi:hypothetical protein